MRKLICTFAIVIIATLSCNKMDRSFLADESLEVFDQETFEVGRNAALRVAMAYSGGKELESVYPYVFQGDTAFFIANFADGWCIVSNDQRTTPILAKADEGNLYLDNLDNTNLQYWLETAVGYVQGIESDFKTKSETDSNINFWENIPEIKAKKKIERIKTKDLFDSLETLETYAWGRTYVSRTVNSSITNNQIGPLTQTKWGQGSPWNNEMPGGCVLGCVPVAVAQVFYSLHNTINAPNGLYHNVVVSNYSTSDNIHYDVTITHSDYHSLSTRWEDMPLTSSGSNTSYVGDLIMYIGEVMGTSYSTTGSGTFFSSGVFTANHLAYSTAPYSPSIVSSSLGYGLPVLVIAGNTSGTKHCWIIDGIINKTDYCSDNYRWYRLSPTDPVHPPLGTEYFTEEQALSIDPYVYDGKTMQVAVSQPSQRLLMNWGWNGLYDNAEYSSSVEWRPRLSGPTYISPATIYYDFHWMSYLQ